ncbi:head-to-tail adaptor [Mycobacterium phage Funsized]|nr:head-to-tail adaptor [Mycobacterium phage Funsized]
MAFTWPIDRTGFPDLPATDAPEYPRKLAEQRAAAQLAVTIMWSLSGRQFGTIDQTARPCRVPMRDVTTWGGRGTVPILYGHTWITELCGCAGACNLSGPNAAHLPGPVAEVTEVKINGVVLPANVWTVEGNVIYRRDAPWPRQDLNRPLGDLGTWGVTYRKGIPVPEGVDQLTGSLAKEFLTAIADDVTRCRLPRTVTVANRQGITYRAYDPAVIYASGKTGLPEVDMWLASVNPNALAAAPTVI